MAIHWSDSLLAEVAERRCILVLGAGASASSVNAAGVAPASWTQFLANGIERIPAPADRAAAIELLESGYALDSAQILADSLGAGDFAIFIRDELETPGFLPSELHELVLRIDPKVIVTTNYDRILESAVAGVAAGYNVSHYYDDHLVNDLRSTRRLIIKAHGCVSDPQRVVLTRKQYFAARRDFPQFFAALDALFLTSTLLFIGSGFSGDPDIELLLQNVNISAPSDHPHYTIIEDGRHSSVIRAIEETHNIKFLQYEQGEHSQVIDALRVLADSVEGYRALGAS
jgi:hypothetical protein